MPGIHAGRAVAFGIEDPQAGTEEVVIVAEVDTADPDERQKIADALRRHISKNSAIALRHVHLVDSRWIVKTSSGKTARSANREKFLEEMAGADGLFLSSQHRESGVHQITCPVGADGLKSNFYTELVQHSSLRYLWIFSPLHNKMSRATAA